MIWFQLRVIDTQRNKYSVDIMDGNKDIGEVTNMGISNHNIKCEAFTWSIMEEYRGMGIIPRAVQEYMKVFGYGKTYQACINDTNRSSQRVAEKLGFTFFCQDFGSWYDPNNRSHRWTEKYMRTYIITYRGNNNVELSNAA